MKHNLDKKDFMKRDRMRGIDRRSLDKLLKELKQKTTVLYMMDNRENRRVVF